jgi:DNA polymerase I-like protein with 3'-5' exonuclease and polymerase domains
MLLRFRPTECPHIGVDTETTGLNPHLDRVRLVQLGSKDFALIVDLDGWRVSGERQVPWEAPGLRQLKALLEGPSPKILQNAAFDINFLLAEGVDLGGPVFDTMIAAKLVNNGTGAKNDLGSIVERVLKVPLSKELQKANWGDSISEEMLYYAARDVICLPFLTEPLMEALKGSRTRDDFTLWDLFKIEMSVLRPIAMMQWYGFGFDKEGAEKLHKKLEEEAEILQSTFLELLDSCIKQRHSDDPSVWLPRNSDGSVNTRARDSGSIRLGTKVYAGFNPRSPKQMAARFEQAGILLPPSLGVNSTPSLDQNLLAFMRAEYELIDSYLTWKAAATRVSGLETLLAAVGSDGRIHCSYRQMGTETGRLSAAAPNLQQVNRSLEFRSQFVAAPGYSLVVADFSQIELRVAAELSGEERMIEAYRAGRDLHTETAALMTGTPLDQVTKKQRTSAKVANFGLLYGAGPATLRKQAVAQYGIDMTHAEAKEIVEGFRAAYPRLYEWQCEEGNKTTKAVFTALGRRRILAGFNDKYTTRINTQVQGTAGDIAKLAIRRLWAEILATPMDGVALIAMVHDEIVIEVPEAVASHWGTKLKQCMEEAGVEVCTKVPIVAEVSHGRTWADAK